MSYLAAKHKHQAEPENNNDLLCSAFECPNRWSIDMGRKLCSAHAWSDPHDWARITQEQHSARLTAIKPHYEPIKRFARHEKEEAIKRLHRLPKVDAKAWAYKLREMEQSGERLSPLQKQMWRNALGGA